MHYSIKTPRNFSTLKLIIQVPILMLLRLLYPIKGLVKGQAPKNYSNLVPNTEVSSCIISEGINRTQTTPYAI